MSLNKPNQQIRRNLKDAANTRDDLAHQIFKDVQQRGDKELMAAAEQIAGLHKHIDALRAYADEVKAGRIARSRAE